MSTHGLQEAQSDRRLNHINGEVSGRAHGAAAATAGADKKGKGMVKKRRWGIADLPDFC